MTPEQEKAERLAFEADWRERNGNTFYCESVWRGWKAGRAALLAERDALRRDLARAEDSTRGFVADIENLNKQVRELRAFQAMVNRHRPEFPADPDGIRDVWYWQGDGEDRLESMVHQLPVVIRAEQLRELLAEQAKPSPAGWRFNRIGEREIEIHCPTFTTPLVVSLDVSDRRLLAFYNLAADLVDAQPQPKGTLTDAQIDDIVDRHYRHKNHPDSYAALRGAIKDALAAAAVPLAPDWQDIAHQLQTQVQEQAMEIEALRDRTAALSREAWEWSKALEAVTSRMQPRNIVALPPLPLAGEFIPGPNKRSVLLFTADQMREYARQAVHEAEEAWQARTAAPSPAPAPTGWVTSWPSIGGGRKAVYSDGAEKPNYGPELNERLKVFPVYADATSPAVAQRAQVLARIAEYAENLESGGIDASAVRGLLLALDAESYVPVQPTGGADVPPDILQAAQKIEAYFANRGVMAWKLDGLQSRWQPNAAKPAQAATVKITVKGSMTTIDVEWGDAIHELPPGEYPLMLGEGKQS